MSHVQFHECSVLSDTLKTSTETAGMTRRNETLSSIRRQDLQGLELGGGCLEGRAAGERSDG